MTSDKRFIEFKNLAKGFVFLIFAFALTGCASNQYKNEIPIYKLSIGMNKDQVVGELGLPHKFLGSENRYGSIYETWMYQKDEHVWVTGNAWVGGTQRLERTIYLLDFKDNILTGWRNNDMEERAPSSNTYEIRNK